MALVGAVKPDRLVHPGGGRGADRRTSPLRPATGQRRRRSRSPLPQARRAPTPHTTRRPGRSRASGLRAAAAGHRARRDHAGRRPADGARRQQSRALPPHLPGPVVRQLGPGRCRHRPPHRQDPDGLYRRPAPARAQLHRALRPARGLADRLQRPSRRARDLQSWPSCAGPRAAPT